MAEENITMDLTEVNEEVEESNEEVTETNEEPLVSTEEPLVSTEEPVVEETSEEPLVSTEEPLVSTEEPLVSAEVTEEPEPVVEEPSPEVPVVEEPSPEVPVVEEPFVSTEEPSVEEISSELKQKIAELDHLRICCGNWVESGIEGRGDFLDAWINKNVLVDPNINYVNILLELEKMSEIVKLLSKGKITTESNHFKNIKSYTLDKHIFNEKSITEKVDILEQLVKLLDFERGNLCATYDVNILGV